MDVPPCMLAAELLDFYPQAKVVLSRRRDLDAWHRSTSDAAKIVLGSWVDVCAAYDFGDKSPTERCHV